MNLVYREYLFAPIRHVAFFEQSLKLTDAHAIQHSELGHALIILTLQVLPHLFLILRTHLCCGGGGVVVRPHNVPLHRHVWCFVTVSPHACLQRSVESFDDARLRLLVVSGEVMDAVLLQQRLNGTIQKFKSFICLQRLWPAFGQRTFQRCHPPRGGLVLQRNTPGHFREDIDRREEKGRTVVVVLQIRKVDATACHCRSRPPTTTRRLLK